MTTNLGTWLGTLASIHMIEIFSGEHYSDALMLGIISLGLILDFFSGWLGTLRALSTRINFRLFFFLGSRKETNEIIV
jgi:hypothetical protein